ncbi:VOC family protein [Sutcliffiella deserti]|uniref:VOC family protein n=1 Tax=Sutcliffiella deserti TaxID=2875501 RepID=UPI001CBB910A|nr:VOC family protein [Sutcliffiella deserti]
MSLVHEGVPLVLEKADDGSTGRNQGVLLGIQSENIKNDFASLKEKGVKMLFEEPQPCPPGFYFVIEDPAGNKIEIVEFSK